MTESYEIKIEDYNESMAESIAQMWNTWDELWPGGFTQGVPYTAERVHKQFGKSDALAILIAINQENKKPVGSCTLFAHWRDKEAAYVGTLGVSPEALGKKVGKKLLLESLARAVDRGYTRVDLNTWPGNMKAVPLYKKIGMMWNPEIGGVQMEDYIPGIIQHPFCEPFFAKLSKEDDWYNVHVREPIQAPDDHVRNEMAIYPYEFKNGDDSLSVVIDRYGRGITSIDRKIGNSRILLDASVDSHTVLCGLSHNYTLSLQNDSEKPIPLSAEIVGFDGLHFDGTNSMNKTIEPGETYSWEVPFHLDSETDLFREEIKAPSIIAKISVAGIASELSTGIKVKPAAELRTRWGESRIAPGGSIEVPVTVISNIKEKSIAKIKIDTQNAPLSVKSLDEEIDLPANGLGGTILQIASKEEISRGTHDIFVSFVLESKSGSKITTRKYRIPLYCITPTDVAIGTDDRLRRVVAVSSKYSANIAIEGGLLRISDAEGIGPSSFLIRSAIGPPFGINPFRFAEREPSISTTVEETTVSMKANHPDRPLIVEDRTSFEHGTGLIRHEVWVTNTNAESETFQLRLYGRGGGISFTRGTAYIPFKEGVVKENLGNFYFGYPTISGDPSDYSEGWIATEQNSKFVGQFWDMETVDEVRFGTGQISLLGFPMVTISPGETRRLSRIWIAYGLQDWRDVQNLWKFYVKKEFESEATAGITQEVSHTINLDLKPVVIPSLDAVTSQLTLRKMTLAPLPGQLSVTAPKGWKVSFEDQGTKSSKSVSLDVQLMQDTAYDLNFTPGDKAKEGFCINRGQITFATDWDIKKKLLLVQLGSKQKQVKIVEDTDQGAKVYRVNNGLIDFVVSPEFGGCLFSLRNKHGVEFLTSAFPTPTPKPGGFLDNYYGGIQPIVFDDEMGADLTNAKTNKEKMKAENYEHGIWKGVEIKWKGKVQQATRGVYFSLRYLTAPGSPLVLIEWIIKNKTTAPMRFFPSIFIDPKVDEELAGNSILTEWDGVETSVRKGMIPVAVSPSKNYAWLKPQSGVKKTSGFGFIMEGESSRIVSATLGDVLLLGSVDGLTYLEPGGEKIIRSCILVDPASSEDVRELQEILEYL